MFGGLREDSMGGVKRCILMLVLCIFAPSIVIPSASSIPPQHNSQDISFNQGNGMIFDEVLQLNGSSISSLTESIWRLAPVENNAAPFSSGKFTSVVAVTEGQWDWELVVNVSSHDCTCALRIFDSNESIHPVASRIVYLGDQNHRPHILRLSASMNGVMNEKPLFQLSQSNLALSIPVVMPLSGSEETFVKMGVCPAPYGFCLTEMIDFFNFNSTTNDDRIEIEIGRLSADLADGFWQFNITLTDALLRTSNTEHFMLLVDQNLPNAILSCDVATDQNEAVSSDIMPQTIVVTENTSLSFSASVDDGYAGGQNILTWTLVLPDNSRRALLSSEQVSESLITLNPEISGTWSIELLVRDSAGWLSHSSINFTVENVAPVVMVELDSFVVLSGATVSLSSNGNWTLNSSQSSDTVNDVADLIHTWYINDNTHATGKMVLNSSDFPKPGVYDVLLVVEDNDGVESELSFEVKINEDVDSSTISSKTLLFSGSALLVFILILSMFVISNRKRSRQTVVPKWVSNSDLSDDEHM